MTEQPQTKTDTQRVLGELVEKTRALTALLITKQGTVISEAGATAALNTTAMAALIAGMFSATREVAKMVGEQQFSILLQQGETRHIHISLVTDATMMVIVFEDYGRTGRIRYEAKKSGEALAEMLTAMARPRGSNTDIPVPEFKEYALNLIDQIFTSK